MKFIFIICLFIVNSPILHSMDILFLRRQNDSEGAERPRIYCKMDMNDEFGLVFQAIVTNPAHKKIMDTLKHWEAVVEQQDFEIGMLGSLENPQLLAAAKLLLNQQQQAVQGFISKIEKESMEELLDDLLLYRIEYIKSRKRVVDKAKQQGADYPELAPRSEEREAFCQSNHGIYGISSYNNNLMKSFCLHVLLKEVSNLFPDPRVLSSSIKDRICLQPSLFSYLNGGDEIPWALDYTLGLPGLSSYHDIPDYTLIMDYFEKTTPQTTYQYSTFHKESKTILVSRAEAGQRVKYSLPDPEFLKKHPTIKTIALQETQQVQEILPPPLPPATLIDSLAEKIPVDSISQEISTVNIHGDIPQKPSMELSVTEDKVTAKIGEAQLKKPRVYENLRPQPSSKSSIFSRVENWLQDILFNPQIRTISSREWEHNLQRIDGVTINRSSGSSHFEVYLNDRCVGGYFRTSTEYGLGYRKWLQKIIEDLGYVSVK